MDMCEYCSKNGIETPATCIVTYKKSDAFDLIREDEDKTITMLMCDCCAENGCPTNSRKVAI